MGAYRGQKLKNGRETLFLGQILTFKRHFITLSLASSPFVRTTSPQGAFRNSLRNLKLFPFSPASPFPAKLAARLLREPCLFALSRLTKGLEGGGVCGCKRFARDNPNEQQSMAQPEQPGGLFTGARRQRRKSLRPHHL